MLRNLLLPIETSGKVNAPVDSRILGLSSSKGGLSSGDDFRRYQPEYSGRKLRPKSG